MSAETRYLELHRVTKRVATALKDLTEDEGHNVIEAALALLKESSKP